jgi:hypothetical protein
MISTCMSGAPATTWTRFLYNYATTAFSGPPQLL